MRYHQTIRWASFLVLCVIAFTSGDALAGEENGYPRESWSVAKIAGEEAGWSHERVTRLEEDGRVLFRTETWTEVKIQRAGETMTVSTEGWTVEDSEGNVVKAQNRSRSSGRETVQELEVKGGEAQFTLTTVGTPRTHRIPWEKDVLGPEGIRRLRVEKGAEAGTKYSYRLFMLDQAKMGTVTTEVLGVESAELLDDERAELTHAVSTVDIIPGVKMHEWATAEGGVVKTSVAIMGFTIEAYRASEERARSGGGGAELRKDLLLETGAKCNVNLPGPYRLDSILYRFEPKDAEIGLPAWVTDHRQEILWSGEGGATLRISARVPGTSQMRPLADPPEELAIYLAPNAFLQCDDSGLLKKALEVIGDETDAWKAACLLERFVFEYIADKNYGTGFASALEVLETRSGDCTEHGVLLSALCRAVGIPSRVALGYMYIGGIFGGHLWSEVWIEGEWYALDGVMGIGRVDPTHITLATSSLERGGAGEMLTAVVQGLGNLEVSILEFTRGDKTVKIGEDFKDYVIEGDTYTNVLYGIRLRKPEGCAFADYERDFSKPSFTLVKVTGGEVMAELRALPASFSLTMDTLKKALEADGVVILSEEAREVRGRKGALLTVEIAKQKMLLQVILDQDTCYTLMAKIGDAEGLEKIIASIEFTE